MPNQPFLVFPRPIPATRAKLGSGPGPKFRKPTPAQQKGRLEERFQEIAAAFKDIQGMVAGVEPEQVIVLETDLKSVEGLAKAAAKIPGLEWLAERDLDEVEPEFNFQNEDKPDAKLPRRLYALFSNQQAMDALVALWRNWTAYPDRRAARNFGPFKEIFAHLRDIRRWGPRDRIADTGIVAQWQEDIAVKGAQGTILFEVELWFRSNADKQQEVYDEVSALVIEAGGQCLDSAAIAEISYHAILAELPADVIEKTINQLQAQEYSKLLRSEGVMFLRPQARTHFDLLPLQNTPFNFEARLVGQPGVEGPPIVALFDGLPLENHRALAGRLIVDDPDGYAQLYASGEQHHGTAMASLILHGDLNGSGRALRRPLYARPILHPADYGRDERTPSKRLLVDLIHRAVLRIFEREGDEPAVAPSVRIINVSICNRSQPFDREVSPLARLLDWLSWKYKLLFVVSIGNCASDVTIEESQDGWEKLSEDELVSQVLRSLERDQHRRRPLSPAEAINCISVGAVHADECGQYNLGQRVDLLKNSRIASPLSTVSNGFRRSTKPEILLPGGRQLYMRPIGGGDNPASFPLTIATNAPGSLTATPGIAPLETGRVKHSCGTSNATALASRCAALAYEQLIALHLPEDSEPLSALYEAAILKAILVHSASWGDASEILVKAIGSAGMDWRERVRLLQQFLGYGEVEIERCVSSTNQRATLLGWASITDGQGHLFRLPLPPSLSASKELRQLRATLAWFTPTNHRHRNYRRAQLFLTVPGDEIGTSTIGVDSRSAQRGTVEHRIFEGSDAKAFLDGTDLTIQVNCKADAGKIESSVPYAIAVTLEVGSSVTVDIYQEIRARLRPQIVVSTPIMQ